ncbi:MAG: thioredoxin domain-containing protein [Planctomycetota bacterium]
MANGTTHGPLLQLSDDTFDDTMAHAGGVVVVEFWAAWCNPCRMIEPVVQQVAADSARDGSGVSVAQVDTDQNRELANRYEINAVPTIIIFKDGAPRTRFVGLVGYDKLATAIDSLSETDAAHE